MTIHDEIAKLPEWPPKTVQYTTSDQPYHGNTLVCHVMAERDAALARLALLREWVAKTHLPDCRINSGLSTWPITPIPECNCGRDALLAALEVPK